MRIKEKDQFCERSRAKESVIVKEESKFETKTIMQELICECMKPSNINWKSKRGYMHQIGQLNMILLPESGLIFWARI